MNTSLETFLDLAEIDAPTSTLIAAGTGAVNGAEVDLQDCDGCIWIVHVTDENTTGTLQIELESSATSGSGYVTATDLDGNDVDTGAAAITAIGTYVIAAKAERLNRYARIVATVGTVGIDFTMFALPYGKTYNAKPSTSIADAPLPVLVGATP